MMKQSMLFLLVLGLISLGCSGNNKAATSDSSNNTAQPSSSSDKSAAENPNISPNSSTTANASSDQKFVEDAIKGNRAEVTLGKMVASKTKDPGVKQFAQMMVQDHTKALGQLQQLAKQKNIAVPDGLPDDAQQLQSKLQSESGKQFDKDYMDGMVQDHQKDVQEFQDQSQKAKDPDVKQLASQLLPTLQRHLDKAQQLDSKVNGGSGKSSGE
jgi:putative membrane protein